MKHFLSVLCASVRESLTGLIPAHKLTPNATV
jgi:hypothetical protein